MTSAFLILTLIQGGNAYIKRADISSIVDKMCEDPTRGLFDRNQYAPCTLITLANGTQMDVKQSHAEIIELMRKKP